MIYKKDLVNITITIEKEEDEKPFCFIVFSSKEKHNEIIIDNIENVINEKKTFLVRRLDTNLISEDSQYKELSELIKKCSFGIVILNGLRPNIVFEYGILKGLEKPCIVLVEQEAEIDVKNFYKEALDLPNPILSIDKHFSDIKDNFHITYDRYNMKDFRSMIKDEYENILKKVEIIFIRSLIPNYDELENELEQLLKKLYDYYKMNEFELKEINNEDLVNIVKKLMDYIDDNIDYNLIYPEKLYYIMYKILVDIQEYEYAIIIVDKILKKREDLKLMSSKATVLRKMKKYKDAIELINKVIEIEPKEETYWHVKGVILEKMGEIDEAIKCYEIGIKQKNVCNNIYALYGSLLFEKEDYEGALKQFLIFHKVEPLDDHMLVYIGQCYNKLDNKEEAKKFLKKATKLNDKNEIAWFSLGLISTDPKESLFYFDKAISINSEFHHAICSKAAVLSNRGDYQEAILLFKDIEKKCKIIDKCEELFLNMITTTSKAGDYDQTLEYIEKYENRFGNTSEIIIRKSNLLIKKGSIDDGINLIESLKKSEGEDPDFLYDYACILALGNFNKKALRVLKKLLKIDKSKIENIINDSDFDNLKGESEYKKLIKTS